jgi:hypothetical protein
MKSWQFRLLETGTRLIVTVGKLKGTIDEVSYKNRSSVYFRASGDEVPYVNCEYVDSHNNPIFEPVRDMTGRPIGENNWVVYSKPAGNSSHALELGKVMVVTKAGGLKVERSIRNGQKTASARGWSAMKETTIITDSFRCLLLPVTDVHLTSWVMMGFENLGNLSDAL